MTGNTLKISLSAIALALMASSSWAADQPIYGSELMTRQERIEHRAKMNAAKSVQEREQVRLDHHEQMQLRLHVLPAAEEADGGELDALVPRPGADGGGAQGGA